MKAHVANVGRICVASCIGLLTIGIYGQTLPDSSGTPTASSTFPVEHGMINLANGALHLEIPIANYAQRGNIQQPVALVYDSNIWKANYDAGTDSAEWSANAITPSGNTSNGGWYVSFAPQNQSLAFMPTIGFTCQSNGVVGTLVPGFSWTDQQGTTRVFPAIVTTGMANTQSCTGTDGNTYTNTPSASAYAVDGSGYLGIMAFHAPDTNLSLNVFDREGTLVASNSFNQSRITSVSGIKVTNGPMLPVDRNGNSISLADAIPQDTIGRTLLSDSGIITESGVGTVEYLTVPVAGGGTATYTINYTTVPFVTNFGVSYINDIRGNLLTVSSIVLPDGSEYSFQYEQNSFGELTGMTLPHGGQVSFSYQTSPGLNVDKKDKTTVLPIRWVQSHTGSDGATTFQWSESASSQYSEPGVTCNLIENQVTTLSTLNTYQFSHCGGNILLQETDHGVANSSQIDAVDLYSYDTSHPCPSWSIYIATDHFYYPSYLYTTQPCTGLMWMNLTGKTTKLLPPPGSNAPTLTTDTQYVYGNPGTGRPTAIKQWDYYAASPTSLPDNPPGLPARETDTTYGYSVNGVLFPTEVDQRDSTGAIASTVKYTYDESAYMSGAAPSTTPNHNSAYVTGNRGNVTTVSRCCGWNGTNFATLISHVYYDDAGVVTATLDAKGNKTSVQYDATDLYPQTITLPSTGTPAVSHVIQKTFDFNSGEVQTSTDENNQTTTYNFDSIGRPSSTVFSNAGNPVTLQTTTYPSANETDVSELQSAGVWLSSSTIVDGFGRTMQEISSGISTETSYDTQGRRYSVTNAHLSTPSSTDGTTYYTYDELGRVKSVKMPNGSSNIYTYSQNSVTITDPTNRSRQLTSDAFGDIVSVLEPDSSGALTYATTYQYNWQGKLSLIQQKGGTTDTTQWRQRSLSYDPLGELISQTTPEAGMTQFSYDSNGNLISSSNQNAANNKTSYSYDNLDRLISQTVDGGATYTYTYDAQDSSKDSYGKGLLTGTSNGLTVQTIYQHDPLGRVISTAYCLPSDCSFGYSVQAQYDFQGNVTSLTYPDGRNLQLTYDLLNRPTSQTFAKFGTSTVGTPYVSNLSYYPGGQFQQATFGSGIQGAATYDWDQNPSSMVYTAKGSPIVERTYAWDSNASNLTAINDLASGRTQSYNYDQMSRLQNMNDTGTTAAACTAGLPAIAATSQSFSIDPWGNLNQSGTYSFQQVIDKNNRIAAGQGYVYDSAGNLTQETLGSVTNSYTYRADGLMTASNGITYTYDALGQRVRKDGGPLTKEYFYFGGQLLAMRDSGGNWTDRIYGPTGALATVPGTPNGQPTYRVSDHLGSLSYTLDASGNILGASAVYPFGQVVSNTTGDDFLFTDHERDTENNTDATLYRHYSSAQGRWLSPDPSSGSYDLADPQSLNRYAYVTNRPMANADALGLDDDDDDDGGGDGGGWSINIDISGFFSDIGDWFSGLFGGWDPMYQGPSNPIQGINFSTQPSGPPSSISSLLTLAFNGDSTGASSGSWSIVDASPGNGLDRGGLTVFPMLGGAAPQANGGAGQRQQQTSGQDGQSPDVLSYKTTNGGPNASDWYIQWKLSQNSPHGGWIVQHVRAFFTDDNKYREYWEAFQIPKGGQYVYPHSWTRLSSDDRFSGAYHSVIKADARFYEGLTLPKSFVADSVGPAGILRATYQNPHLSTRGASNLVYREWYSKVP